MPADRAAGLRAAAARKRELATARASAATRELDQRGEDVTFQSVARHAGVSRQWLYEQPALRAEIEQLRDQRDRPGKRVPSAQQASDRSLRQHIDTLRDENRRLREENTALKAELALAYGRRRETGQARHPETRARERLGRSASCGRCPRSSCTRSRIVATTAPAPRLHSSLSYVLSASARRPRSQRRRHVNNVNPQQAEELDISSLR